MGYDAERAEDEYSRMSPTERDQADREFDAVDAMFFERYGSLLPPDCAEGDGTGWCGHSTMSHCPNCSGCPGDHTISCDDPRGATDDLDAVIDAFFGDPPGTAHMRRNKKKMADDGFDPPIRNRRKRMDARDNRFYREPEETSTTSTPTGALRLFASLGTASMVEALRAALAAQDDVSRFPVEPPEGTVLRYQKTFPNSPTYTYVALRAGGQWYRTGKDVNPLDWATLVEDIANWPCHLAIEWGEIPQSPVGLFEGEDPAVWYRELYQSTVTVDADQSKN